MILLPHGVVIRNYTHWEYMEIESKPSEDTGTQASQGNALPHLTPNAESTEALLADVTCGIVLYTDGGCRD